MRRDIDEIPHDICILDVGCGIGNSLFALQAKGYSNTVGLDIERQLIEYAKQMVPQARLVVGSAEQIPFRDGAFDCAICYDLLEHVLKPEKVIDNISRVLRENSTIYMSVANGYSINDVVFRLGGKVVRGRSSHVQRFRKRDVETLLRNNGFEIENIHEIRAGILDYVGVALKEKLPFCGALTKLSRRFGKHMSAGWEFKAIKDGSDSSART